MDLTDREKQLMLERDQIAAEKNKVLQEKLKSEEEFGKVRAKFKDLYLQREAEIIKLSDEKSQIEAEISDVRAAALLGQTTAQEELDSLMRRYNEEVRLYKVQLQELNDKLSNKNNDHNENESSEAENLEQGMLKAQKDAEMLKEIVVPLETELKELKLQCQHLMSENVRLRVEQTKENRPQPTVDMLLDLDDDLGGAEVAVEVNSKEQVEQLEQDMETERQNVVKLKDELYLIKDEMEDYRTRDKQLTRLYNEIQEESTLKTTELEELKRCVQTTETKWNDMTLGFSDKISDVSDNFQNLRELHSLAETEMGEFKSCCNVELEELTNYKKKLSDDFEKLKMKLNDERKTHEDAQALLTDSLESCRKEILRLENVSSELQTSKELNEKLQNDVVVLTDKMTESQRKSKEVILGLQKQILASNAEKEEHAARISRLGKELSESMSVRDELALLSSDLQVQLEDQRDIVKSIKWEHEDDVSNCRGCDVAFSMTKRKSHCRKCGRIFCTECCSKTIEFGANKRQYKACEECAARHMAEQPTEYHTVLVPKE